MKKIAIERSVELSRKPGESQLPSRCMRLLFTVLPFW